MTTQQRPRGRPKSAFKESSAGTLQALDRALVVLKAVAERGVVNLSDLSREVDVPTATTHRILTTLAAHGFVTFDEARQDWSVGLEAYRTGVSYLKQNGILDVSKSVMRELMEQTGETANLGIRDGVEVVFVAQVETPKPIRALFPNGSRASMHSSGTGKAILAALEDAELRRILPSLDTARYTEQTLTTTDALLSDLAETRRRGWSLDREERFEGMSCVGAAIYNEFGLPWAGISVSGPTMRFGDEDVATLGRLVAKAAEEISRRCGGAVPDRQAG